MCARLSSAMRQSCDQRTDDKMVKMLQQENIQEHIETCFQTSAVMIKIGYGGWTVLRMKPKITTKKYKAFKTFLAVRRCSIIDNRFLSLYERYW